MIVRATAGGRTSRIATVKRRLLRGGPVEVGFSLPARARAQLHRTGRLTLTIAVSHSRVAAVSTQTVRIAAGSRGNR